MSEELTRRLNASLENVKELNKQLKDSIKSMKEYKKMREYKGELVTVDVYKFNRKTMSLNKMTGYWSYISGTKRFIIQVDPVKYKSDHFFCSGKEGEVMRDVVWFREGNPKSSYANVRLIFLNHYKEELKAAEDKVAMVTKIIDRLEEEGE